MDELKPKRKYIKKKYQPKGLIIKRGLFKIVFN